MILLLTLSANIPTQQTSNCQDIAVKVPGSLSNAALIA